MSDDKCISKNVVARPLGVGKAVGVSEAKWYVAQMARNNVEKATAERLCKQGYECYVATQEVIRVWRNGRRRKTEQVVIPFMVFIHCTEKERLVVAHDSNISRFLTNRAMHLDKTETSKIVTISDKQIEQLKFMLGQSDMPVNFEQTIYKVGDSVRVIRGSLMGLEGEVADMSSSKSELTLVIHDFGCAKIIIDTANLELIN